MSKVWGFVIFFIIIGLSGSLWLYYFNLKPDTAEPSDNVRKDNAIQNIIEQVVSEEPKEPEVILLELPSRKVLNNSYHIFQSFNNCGPASLSMALSYYGHNISQQELGQSLRPYQNAQGDNDDKSVTLSELAEKSKEYNLIPYHRPNGTVDIVKNFIANDMPVVTRTWLKPNEDIGHYRVIKGYDDSRGVFIQDDSLQGKNLEYIYEDFFDIWKPFSFEYLVLVPKDKVKIAEAILAENIDPLYSWEKSLEVWSDELQKNPSDVNARFNLSIALYYLGRYKESVEEFEKIENNLPQRALWYQIEPIKSYYELKEYDRVFAITNNIINNHNRAFSELYIIRGDIYKAQNNITMARTEYEKALQYNKNLQQAKDALDSI